MALNTIALSTMFQQGLDEQLVAGARTSFMEQNADQLIFTNNKTVQVPKMSVAGLSDYDVDAGFTDKGIAVTYENFQLEQDRQGSFLLDSHVVTESNFVATAGNVMSTFLSKQVIPEIDKYRLSKIATVAKTASRCSGSYTPAVGTILTTLKTDLNNLQDSIGTDVPLVIIMSTKTLNILELSTEVQRQLAVGTFQGNGDLVSQVKYIDSTPIIEVPSDRMLSSYVFGAGTVTGGALNTNWIIMPVSAPIAVAKTTPVRIFLPEVVQTHDAFKIQFRIYHDLFLKDNVLAGVFVNFKEALV